MTLAAAVLVAAAGAPVLPAQTAAERAFTWGFEQRVRSENWDNILDYNGELPDLRNQVRYRTRLWANLPVTRDIDLYAGLNQETNQVIRTRAPWRFDEAIVENAYVDFKRLFTDGLSLRVGRQNLIRGEGWLILEGNPFDGSRSIYFNAFDFAYSWKKSKLEVIGILNPKTDRFLPRVPDRHRPLIEWDERAIGLYYTDRNSPRTSLESYYFYKTETRDSRGPGNPQYQPDRRFHTAGGRIVHSATATLDLAGELALQWGRQDPDSSIAAWGGYGYAKRRFGGPLKPYLQAGWWGFSGDNPGTAGKIEGWNPLFGRWPKWSELYIYTQWKEVGVAYWTNLGMWQGEAGFSPSGAVDCRATFYRMDAFHPFPGSSAVYGRGTQRGNMYQGRVDLRVGRHWSGHVLWEHMLPGGFYSAKTPGYFLRFEVIYALRGAVPL